MTVGDEHGLDFPTTRGGILGRRLWLLQPAHGFRFAVDSILLAHFAGQTGGRACLDLCAGCGVVGLILFYMRKVTDVTAVEIDPGLARLAQLNAAANGFSENFRAFCEDYRSWCAARLHKPATERADDVPARFDLAVANPPFFPVGSGRRNIDAAKSAARHELHGTLKELYAATAPLLRPGGSFCTVYPAARLPETLRTADAVGLRVARLRLVHPRRDEPAVFALVESVRGGRGATLIEAPLVLHEGAGRYSPEAEAIFQGEWRTE